MRVYISGKMTGCPDLNRQAFDALVRGDKVQAIEECYDAIAVLLRTIDVLEGRKKLGKNETKGDEK